MKKDKRIIFISWTSYHSHTQLLGNALGANIFYINHLITSRKILWKLFFIIDYLYKSYKTLIIIIQNKPEIVVVQNPPSIAPIVIVFFGLFAKYKIVLDSHNGAFERPWVDFPFHKWALEHAEVVIIHNDQLFNEVTIKENFQHVKFLKLGSRPYLFDKVLSDVQKIPYFIVISTFHSDEPMKILLEGIKEFNKINTAGIKFKITGNYEKNLNLCSEFSRENNVEFMGFIKQEEYNNLLVNAFGSISLSTRENVQQFSVIESISAGIPFISSDNLTNRDLFGDKMILTENSPPAIAKSIELFIKDRNKLEVNVQEIRKILIEKWENDFNIIKKELGI